MTTRIDRAGLNRDPKNITIILLYLITGKSEHALSCFVYFLFSSTLFTLDGVLGLIGARRNPHFISDSPRRRVMSPVAGQVTQRSTPLCASFPLG